MTVLEQDSSLKDEKCVTQTRYCESSWNFAWILRSVHPYSYGYRSMDTQVPAMINSESWQTDPAKSEPLLLRILDFSFSTEGVKNAKIQLQYNSCDLSTLSRAVVCSAVSPTDHDSEGGNISQPPYLPSTAFFVPKLCNPFAFVIKKPMIIRMISKISEIF